MLNEALASATTLRWTQVGAGGTLTIGNAALVAANWSPAIPTADVDQIELGLTFTSTAASTFVMQLRGSHNGATWFLITARALGAVVGSAQRYTPLIYELGPVPGAAAGTPIDEARPWAWHFLSIGFYNPAGAPAANDVVDVVVERQRGGQVQGPV